jgi:hypothetical protein
MQSKLVTKECSVTRMNLLLLPFNNYLQFTKKIPYTTIETIMIENQIHLFRGEE